METIQSIQVHYVGEEKQKYAMMINPHTALLDYFTNTAESTDLEKCVAKLVHNINPLMWMILIVIVCMLILTICIWLLRIWVVFNFNPIL